MTALARLLGTSTVRWLIVYCVLFGVGAAGVIGYIFWQTDGLMTRQVIQTLQAEVQGLREQFDLGGVPLLKAAVSERSEAAGSGLYLLGSSDGTKLAGNLSGFPPELPSDPGGGAFHYTRQKPGGPGSGDRLAVGVAISVPAGLTLVVARDIEDQREFANSVRSVLLWALASIAALGLGGGWLAGRSIVGRIEAIRATAETIVAGNLSRRVPLTGSGDEFDRLARSLNGMLERIEQLMTGMREVSDNIAHDLRTPLSRLRTRLESALREAKGGGVEPAAVTGAIEDTDDLIKAFNSMLSLARLEAGTAGEFTQTNVSVLAADAAELYEPVAEEKGVALTTAIAGAVLVDADRQLLGQAVTNLIENALKYGNGTSVTVSVQRNGSDAEIAVADHGPGIAPADRDRALQRFVRLEASRSLPGSGLGLSLAAAVAKLHGGAVRLEDNHPGLRVVIALPAATPQTLPGAV